MIDILIQFIVLLAIMAMWALTSCSTGRPSPCRLAKQCPTGTEAGRIRQWQAEPVSTAADSRRRPPQLDRAGSAQVRREASGSIRDPFVSEPLMRDHIIGSDNRGNRTQPSLGSHPRTSGSGRKSRGPDSARSRSAPLRPRAPRPKEADHQRALTSLVNQSLAQKKNRPLEITPLSSPLSPSPSPLTQSH